IENDRSILFLGGDNKLYYPSTAMTIGAFRAYFKLSEELKVKSEELSTLNCQLSTGLIVTGDWFVDSREKMREIVGNFPDARAVDMESAAIAQACYLNKVPFISFRVVSDIPLRDTDASQYHDFWNTIAKNSFHITRKFVESL
ncbi:MAG: 5'-methylthioadenosine/S-adenosylhomocysteine nucleosidase, partial [Prevotella sp.]|nr:5'-methylthioadenosine/S-adenosylhomocysteine nucleosidase [Prevotella sp.]